ncbi:PadR family transcriptional regulator [Methanolobus vulcani]|uniref:Helix-turn-helix transcriptional regulator n=1 Tax=Methanolobus vulcani TaxID=38026 RepID=A0A7Z8KQH8_9EURY|nr:PadR family transcriptional regulator [Methanolobus vulcani]TQD27650.1 helix-turn-helix transcriptional regulator [Methanolobus vulcani]
MSNIWKFTPESGKERGLLTALVLHLLEMGPKSGYDLLKEIAEKTGGSWTPNKGTLYPLLKSLDEEGVIRVKEIGKRSKRIYELTDTGKETITNIRNMKSQSTARVNFFKDMHFEIFGTENQSLVSLLMEMRFYVEDLPQEKKERAIEILEATFEEIKKL